MRVFVRVPSNSPSGGIKVANQLVNLFRKKRVESFLVPNEEPYVADWMIHPAQVISLDRLMETCGTEDIVIDNWIDRHTVDTTEALKARVKIFYSQGSTFLKNRTLVGDSYLKTGGVYTHYWAVSADAQRILEFKYPKTGKWHLVHPYFERDAIASVRQNTNQREDALLCLARKGKSFILTAKLALGRRIKFHVINRRFTEIEIYELMARHRFFLSTAAGISPRRIKNIAKLLIRGRTSFVKVINPYREGFPLPPAEAALCGSIVIGFAMGGGLEWMSPGTCFLAKNRSHLSIMRRSKEALSTPDEQLENMRVNAFQTLSKFNEEHTWEQIEYFLKCI